MKKASENKRKILNRRGVTIAETVVAMAVIVIVSLTAITLIRRVSVTTMEDQYSREALNIAENAKQCLIYANTIEEFAYAFGSFLKTDEDDSVTVDSKKKEYSMALTRDNYTITLTVDYSAVPTMKCDIQYLSSRATNKNLEITYAKESQAILGGS